eukprot:m.172421 g.172421  ORF g.172421 m.172421 type:complete len:549 (+) comp17858_c4_seq2:447-2093(+)
MSQVDKTSQAVAPGEEREDKRREDQGEDGDEDAVPELDRYGFVLGAKNDINTLSSDEFSGRKRRRSLQTLRHREIKWVHLLNDWDTVIRGDGKHKKRSVEKAKERCRKGIPYAVRGRAWPMLCGANARKARHPTLFGDLAACPTDKTSPVAEFLDIIDRDLNRTFPHHFLFKDVGGQGQADLRDILKAYALYNPVLGYCQGMGMLAGTFLMVMPAEDAFWCLVSVLEEPQYCKGFFDAGLKEVQIATGTMGALLQRRFPKVQAHLEEQGMMPIMFATDWFLCCYVKTLPWESVLRVWDMFLFEGLRVIFRTSIAIMTMLRKHLLKECPTIQELMTTLRNLPADLLQPERLLPEILNTSVKNDELAESYALQIVEFAKAKGVDDVDPPEVAEGKSRFQCPAAMPTLGLEDRGLPVTALETIAAHKARAQEAPGRQEKAGAADVQGSVKAAVGKTAAAASAASARPDASPPANGRSAAGAQGPGEQSPAAGMSPSSSPGTSGSGSARGNGSAGSRTSRGSLRRIEVQPSPPRKASAPHVESEDDSDGDWV